MLDRSFHRLGATKLGLATQRPENRIAYAVAVAIAVLVAIAGRVPLPSGATVDFSSAPSFQSAVQATFVDFSNRSPGGRLLVDHGRLILNRPLPEEFTVEVQARSKGADSASLSLRIGDWEGSLDFGPQSETLSAKATETRGERVLAFDKSGPGKLEIARISFR